MLTNEARLKGTLISSQKNKERAIENYYFNPKICKRCNKIIKIEKNQKVSDVRKKKFCSRSCSAIFHNHSRKVVKVKKVIKSKEEKKLELYNNWKEIKKGDFFKSCKNYFSARCSITKYAKRVMKYSEKEKICKNCGYDKHVEICHILSVASFSNESSLYDITNENNLMYLCPNCHWEFDNNILHFGLEK